VAQGSLDSSARDRAVNHLRMLARLASRESAEPHAFRIEAKSQLLPRYPALPADIFSPQRPGTLLACQRRPFHSRMFPAFFA
jgi:hypothetical protein